LVTTAPLRLLSESDGERYDGRLRPVLQYEMSQWRIATGCDASAMSAIGGG